MPPEPQTLCLRSNLLTKIEGLESLTALTSLDTPMRVVKDSGGKKLMAKVRGALINTFKEKEAIEKILLANGSKTHTVRFTPALQQAYAAAWPAARAGRTWPL